MIITSHTQPKPNPALIKFLQTKLDLTEDALRLGLRQEELEQAPLPIVLWSFGLLNLSQYQEVLNWEKNHS